MQRRDFLFTSAIAAAIPAAAQPASAPRLYNTPRALARLRDRTRLIDAAKRLLDGNLIPEEVATRGGGQHANYGAPGNQILSMGLTLGLAYDVTGERPYAAKLRDALLHYGAYQRWNGPGKEGRTPQWQSELNGARFCFGSAAAFDAVRGFLSAAERKSIAAAMVRLGILPALEDWVLPATRIHALDSMGHNWWAVCVANAGVGCLALLADEPRAAAWVDQVSANLAEWFDYRGNVLQNKSASFDGGAFYEGVNYENYALFEYLRYRLAYANVFPNRTQPRFPALAQATGFFLQTFYPTSGGFYTLNFGDSGLHASSAATVRLLIDTGFVHPNAGWLLAKTPASGREPVDPLALIARDAPPPVSPDALPTSAIYSGAGWATLRDSWNDDATLLGVKCGFTWNHAHADAGSFVLFHQGAPLITDSGSVNYADPLYGSYYVQSRAHNVLLFNGQGQPAEDIRRGVKFPGRVHDLVDQLGVKYVYADATGPMARYFSRNYRHFLWIGGAILVIDEVRAFESGRFDFLLHHDGAAAQLEGRRLTLTSGKAKAEVRFLFPGEIDIREELGYADHQPRQKTPYFAISPKQPARELKFVTAILPYPENGALPEIEPLAGPSTLGVRVTHGGDATDVYLNFEADGRQMHDNSINRIDGWDTDAYLLALTRPKASPVDPATVTRYFAAGGSFLRKSGQVLLDTLTKQTKVWK